MKFERILWTLLLISAMSLSSLCSAAALKYGDRGDEVKEVQTYLIAQSLLDTEADGVYGTATVNAVKDFQAALGLEVDGVCGAMTYKILRAAAYDEIDITTWKPGDYVPEPPQSTSTRSVLSAVKTVGTVAQYAGVGDVIKFGMEGDGVVHLQNKLIELGFYEGEADGVCGTSTVTALKNFQRSQGIAADGICGHGTYSALDGGGSYHAGDDYDFGLPNYTRVVQIEATGYSRMEPGMSNYTATGTFCKRGVIATDPNFIPLGTKVYIPGYGYAVAEDTGGAIVGNCVDLAFDSVAECFEWGRRSVPMYIIE